MQQVRNNATEALANLIHPFWMLPLVGILAVKPRDTEAQRTPSRLTVAKPDVKNYRRDASDSYETDFTAQTCSPKSLSETRSKRTVAVQGFVYAFGSLMVMSI